MQRGAQSSPPAPSPLIVSLQGRILGPPSLHRRAPSPLHTVSSPLSPHFLKERKRRGRRSGRDGRQGGKGRGHREAGDFTGPSHAPRPVLTSQRVSVGFSWTPRTQQHLSTLLAGNLMALANGRWVEEPRREGAGLFMYTSLISSVQYRIEAWKGGGGRISIYMQA